MISSSIVNLIGIKGGMIMIAIICSIIVFGACIKTLGFIFSICGKLIGAIFGISIFIIIASLLTGVIGMLIVAAPILVIIGIVAIAKAMV